MPLRKLGVPGKHKLAARWKSWPYVIRKMLPGLPVYQICLEGQRGPAKCWVRNHLLPISEMVQVTIPTEESPAEPNRRSKSSFPPSSSTQVMEEEGNEEKNGDVEIDWRHVLFNLRDSLLLSSQNVSVPEPHSDSCSQDSRSPEFEPGPPYSGEEDVRSESAVEKAEDDMHQESEVMEGNQEVDSLSES